MLMPLNSLFNKKFFLVTLFFIFLLIPHSLNAHDGSVKITDLINSNNNKIKQNSTPKAIFQLDIRGKGGRKLEEAWIQFSGTNFSTSDLKSITNNSSSGLSIYEESETPSNGFDINDKLLELDTSSGWENNDVYLTLKKKISVSKNKTFYITIQTSTASSDDHEIQINIPFQGIVLSDNENEPEIGITSTPIYIDSKSPSIHNVNLINPISVDVKFSEAVNEAIAKTKEHYIFNNGLTINQINKIEDNIYRIISNTSIPTASTTLTISAEIIDIAGNTGTNTTHDVTFPINVRISEIATKLNNQRLAEFIELYNTSESRVNISNWKLQYSAYSSKSWSTKATIPNNTYIEPYSYYLVTSASYHNSKNCDAAVDLCVSRLNMLDTGGHVRLFTGTKEVDRIGWGSALYAENLPSSSLSNNESLERKAFGTSNLTSMINEGKDSLMGNAWDAQNNTLDFIKRTNADPQNSSSPPEQPNFSNYTGSATEGPKLKYVPVDIAANNSDLDLFIQAGDPRTPTNNISAEIHYSISSGNSFITHTEPKHHHLIGERLSNGYFKLTIPSSHITDSDTTANGIAYHLQVLTNNGATQLSADPLSITHNEARLTPFTIRTEDPTHWETYNISGIITDENSNPISDALIFAEGTGSSTTTDSTGSYTLNVRNSHPYNLVIIKNGYFEENISNIFINGSDITNKDAILYTGTGGGSTGDNSKPRIIETFPNNRAFGIPPKDSNYKIFINFSEDIDENTFGTNSVTLSSHATDPINNPDIGYNVTYDNNPNDNNSNGYPDFPFLGIVSVPSEGLKANTTYSLILNNKIRDLSGNGLTGNNSSGGHSLTFTTGSDFSSENSWENFGLGKMIPPRAISITPKNGSSNIAPNTKININFSEPMDGSSITTLGNIKLLKTNIKGSSESELTINSTITLDNTKKNVTITPSTNLTSGKYKIIITGAVKSASGIPIGNPKKNKNNSSCKAKTSRFKVDNSSTQDNTKPTLIGSWPINNSIDISTNPGSLILQFSESINPTTIKSDTITLLRGTSQVNGNIKYNSEAYSVEFIPSQILAPNTKYSLKLTGGSAGLADMIGNTLAESKTINFKTASTSDSNAPSIIFANADDNSIAITFSEPMNTSPANDTNNWATSILNPNNYAIKWGNSTDISSTGTIISLSNTNASIEYDSSSNTAIIKNINLDFNAINEKSIYIDMTSENVSGDGATDLSKNTLSGTTSFQAPIQLSSKTRGIISPNNGNENLLMSSLGIMKAGAQPINTLAGQTTTYSVDIPTNNKIKDNFKIILTFPKGFDINKSKQDPHSPANRDLNTTSTGTITFSSETESSGGANNDGVSINTNSNTITIDLSVNETTPNKDYLHLDISGIINSSIPRGPSTSGYSVDIKLLDENGHLSESIDSLPFFIKKSGSANLSGEILGINNSDTNNGGDTVTIYLNSPITGPLEYTADIANDGSGSYFFSNIPEGSYHIFTDPTLTFQTNKPDYIGLTSPEPITIRSNENTKDITLIRADSGEAAEFTTNITGIPAGENVDLIAISPTGYIINKITGNGDTISEKLYLTSGEWKIKVTPTKAKTTINDSSESLNWTSPRPTHIISDGITAQNINIDLKLANKQIVGYVLDDSNNAISDTNVHAYKPDGEFNSIITTTDTNGKFILKVPANGNYSIGVSKPGLQTKNNKNIIVENNNSNNNDSNASADTYSNNQLITDSNKFIFTINKPSYTISGNITDGINTVGYTPIWATKENGLEKIKTVSDSTGNYILYVDNGTWNVQANIPEYGLSTKESITINSEDQTLNISPDTDLTYYTISGTVTINSETQANMPIRAIKYNNNGNLTGEEYIGHTNSSGDYNIKAPSGSYRIDVWTPEYGEIERTDADDYSDNSANLNLDSDKTGINITILKEALHTVTLEFMNGLSSQTAIINIDSTTNDFHRNIKMSSLVVNKNIKLKSDSYIFNMYVPGIGLIKPTTTPNSINSASTITFTLPNSSTELFSLSGTITGASSTIENAWIWIGNEKTGEYTAETTDSSGNYSITLKNGSYKMGVEASGYSPQPPTQVEISSDTIANYDLATNDKTISGTIYSDNNNNNNYDLGEELLDGWAWIEDTTSKERIGAATNNNGTFSISTTNGTYKLKAIADGYSITTFGTLTVNDSNSSNNNIKLIARANWDSKIKSQSITPSMGGSLDDSGQTGAGIKITIPPNALGPDINSGSIDSKEVSNVAQTSSANPLGNIGKEITATDSSGAAITNLSDDIEIELVYYKDDISDYLTDYLKLNTLTNSYWDTSLGNWVAMSTTKTAYTKDNSEDTNWAIATDYNTFVTNLANNPSTYADYKIALNSNTDHLTIFGATTPTDSTPPATPVGLSQTNGIGTSTTINWTDNSENDFLEYEIYRATSTGVTANSINQINSSQVSASSYTDSTTTEFTVYYYAITAADDSGNESTISTELQLCSTTSLNNGSVDNNCTITCDTDYQLNGNTCINVTAPNAPTSLSQTSGSNNSLTLNWADNSEFDLEKYNIYRDTNANFTATTSNIINSSDVTTSVYTDSTVSTWTTYYYQITALDSSSNESATSTELQVCSNNSVNNGSVDNNCNITCSSGYELSNNTCNAIASSSNNSGGGGGGGGFFTPIESSFQTYNPNGENASSTLVTTTPKWQAIVDKANKLALLTTKNANASETEINNNQINTVASNLIASIISEANIIKETTTEDFIITFNTKENKNKADETDLKYIKKITEGHEITDQDKRKMNNFITYGTFTTLRLGTGERAGSINSFISAFEKLPTTLTDWEDVLKIANGRWPNQRNEVSEIRATEEFKNIYKREPNRANPHDDAAVTVMSYGLRPANRSTDSEKAAIKSFKHIYEGNPKSALTWDIVRAIAYSGASR